jgi:hypothetical protein
VIFFIALNNIKQIIKNKLKNSFLKECVGKWNNEKTQSATKKIIDIMNSTKDLWLDKEALERFIKALTQEMEMQLQSKK